MVLLFCDEFYTFAVFCSYTHHIDTSLIVAHVKSGRVSIDVARQVPLSMGFSRQEHRTVLPYPPPGDLPNPGTGPPSPVSPALAGGFFTTSSTWEANDSKAKGSLKVTK